MDCSSAWSARAVQATVADFIDSFASDAAKAKLAPKWERECRILLDAGADVIVPAGGLPMMLYGAESGANIDGAPIVNGITVLAKTVEMFVKMRFTVSRRSNFAKPPDKALKEFLEQG